MSKPEARIAGSAMANTSGELGRSRRRASPRARGSRTMAVDEKLHRVYLLGAEFGPAELVGDEDPTQLLTDGLAMLAMFTGQIAPAIEPAAVEILHGQIGGQHVRGIVDILDDVGSNGRGDGILHVDDHDIRSTYPARNRCQEKKDRKERT